MTEQLFIEQARAQAEDDCKVDRLRPLFVELAINEARELLEEATFLAGLLSKAGQSSATA